MRFFSVLAVIFYTIVSFFIGGLIIWFAAHQLRLEDIQTILQLAYNDLNLRMIVGFCGALLIIISFSFLQLILGRLQKEKTIAFSNPAGQVTVSLSAVEDFVRRLTAHMTEIKELRPDVIINKKGIQIALRVVLREAITIPDITFRLQEMIKSKVQEVLGVEENVSVKIHIVKIATLDDKSKKKTTERTKDEEEPVVPFQGYGSK